MKLPYSAANAGKMTKKMKNLNQLSYAAVKVKSMIKTMVKNLHNH